MKPLDNLYGTVGSGLVTIAIISIVKGCDHKNDTARSTPVKSLNIKENNEKILGNKSLDSPNFQLKKPSAEISGDVILSHALHPQEIVDTVSSISEPSFEERALEEQRIAAITIQKHYRSYLTSIHVKEIKKREDAAITIQSFIRLHATQKLYEQEIGQVLNHSLFEGAKSYTEDSVKLTKAPNAPQGANKYKIYMPQDLPVVIRVCKDNIDSSRFPKMKQALAICSENKFRYVEVPKARLQGSFIVEERLPGENASTIKGMAFYYENREHYAEAVKEFTAFLCYGYLSDIVGDNKHIINYLGISQVPRFDNLLLYFTEQEEEKLYKIGIVDLETFRLNSSKPSANDVYYALSTSVKLFPYHFDAIIEVGKTFFDITQDDIRALHAHSLKSLQIYKIVCEDNYTFYQRHNITVQNQILVSLTPERREELKKHMGSFVRNMHDHGLEGYYGVLHCLNDNPDASAHLFQEELCPKVILLIEKSLNRIFSFSSQSPHLISYGELIERRMICNAITSGLKDKLERKEKKQNDSSLLKAIFNSPYPPIFAIIEEILNQLVKGGELSYYKAQVYGSDDLIFF